MSWLFSRALVEAYSGGLLLGWRTVCAVECDPYAASVLCARQNDGILAPFPIWDDVRTFDGRPWRGIVDVVSGGFPCQDISCAGRGAGLSGERSGLWWEMYRIIGEVRPRYAWLENAAALVVRGIRDIYGAMAELGYDAVGGTVSAADAIWDSCDPGTPAFFHERRRRWCLFADAAQTRLEGHGHGSAESAGGPGEGHARAGARAATRDADGIGQGQRRSREEPAGRGQSADAGWWATEPDVVRMVHGAPARVDRISALGNAQVPAVDAIAWTVLHGRLMETA
jgi:DNA (cytosine-5)-methyltransferase 1